MSTPSVGFAVIYRWRLRPELEEGFVDAWSKVTRLLREERGALGSRLHRGEDGTWVAYAQWPDKEAWRYSRQLEPVDREAFAVMSAATEERFEPVLLAAVRDHLGD